MPGAARVYNQSHQPRPPTPGRRRLSIYVSWSYPGEAGRNVAELDNRFSTMTEVRRAFWPAYEEPRFADPMQFQQGIAGSLELFFWAWVPFQEHVGRVTGHAVPVFQRIDQAGFPLPLDERVTGDVDTLLVFGLDHDMTGQAASPAEIEAVRQFLRTPGHCLLIGPHHDVGVSDDPKIRNLEYKHHGDPLVPRQQRFGRFTRSLLEALDIPVVNRFGCRPAVDAETKKIAPLSVSRELDTRGWLEGVTHFNFHMHLPHYDVSGDGQAEVRVLARQPIDTVNPHPESARGLREINTFLWIPPSGERAGDVVMADSTVFSTLFGGDASLERFWTNLATLR
jgi:hypothetical protein